LSEFRDEELGSLATLVRVVKRLREPDGCPWDRRQSAESLRQFILEEAYETVDAIDKGDPAVLAEELGDLLLQIVLQARIAEEEGRFDIRTVIRSIVTKLIRRHPHVFGAERADTPEEVLRNWNRIKVEEKGGARSGASILDGIPGAMPALFKALSLSRRAAQVGFDWQRTADIISKLREEVDELEHSLSSETPEQVADEIGDVLFVIANIARRLDANPELALEASNRKFMRRFRCVERLLAEQGRTPQDATLEEMDALWDRAKQSEREE